MPAEQCFCSGAKKTAPAEKDVRSHMKSIFVASLFLVLISCGPRSQFRTDGVCRDKQGLRIELLRKQKDPNFAEYKRKIRVIAPDGRNNEKLMPPDIGGTVQITSILRVHRRGERR